MIFAIGHKMTKRQALYELKKNRKLTTAMLKPLGISFESFLRYAQLQGSQADEIVDQLIKYFEEGA